MFRRKIMLAGFDRTTEAGGADVPDAGLLRKSRMHIHTYRLAEQVPVWTATRPFHASSHDPGPLLIYALADMVGVQGAFTIGPTAPPEDREESDIGLLVVEGPEANHRNLFRHMVEVGMLLRRELKDVRDMPQELAQHRTPLAVSSTRNTADPSGASREIGRHSVRSRRITCTHRSNPGPSVVWEKR